VSLAEEYLGCVTTRSEDHRTAADKQSVLCCVLQKVIVIVFSFPLADLRLSEDRLRAQSVVYMLLWSRICRPLCRWTVRLKTSFPSGCCTTANGRAFFHFSKV
jgi:hypothetical protein